ncbi:MAG: TonB-dependent receptor [Bacteroidota bacterium]
MKLIKLRSLFTFLLFLLSFLFTDLHAQDAYISGVITDKATGETLIGANVVVEGTSIGVAADLDGSYTITGVTPGDYILWVSYIGYADAKIPISVAAGEKLKKDVSLSYGGAVGLDEVVITAQAKGQVNAINRQLNSKSIKNVVSAEKIQELPDANAAETLGRLPGVSVNRSGGEGSKVVVRGLSPKYNKVTMEGVSMAASGDDRSADISMISPYSLDGIEVYKAATADKDGEFVGGMIEFKLREARSGFNADVVGQMGYNDLKGTYDDYLVNASISNRFFDDKFGVYFQGNIEKRNRSANTMKGDYDVWTTAAGGEYNKVRTKGASLSDVIREKKRQGATMVLDYRINEGSIKFMNFFSNSNTSKDTYTDNVSSDLEGSNLYNIISGQRESSELMNYSNILAYEQQFNKLKVESKLSHSYSENITPFQLEGRYFQGNGVFDNPDFLYDQVAPAVVLDSAIIDPKTAYLTDVVSKDVTTNERQLAGTLDLTYDFKINDQINGLIKFGGKYRTKQRSKDKNGWGANTSISSAVATAPIWDVNNSEFDELRARYMAENPDADINNLDGLIFYYLADNPDFDHENYMNGDYTMGSVVDLDLLADMHSAMYDYEKEGASTFTYAKTSQSWDYHGTEEYKAGYVMAEVNLGSKIKVIPGVRYENNTTEYTGVYGETDIAFREKVYNNVRDTTVVRNNAYFLPSIHLRVKPIDWFDVRVAYTHTLSRPSYYQIAPRMDVDDINVSFNNNQLVPEYSKNWDVYFSFHSNNLGLLTVGGFTKAIENMIFDPGYQTLSDPSVYGLPASYEGKIIRTTINSDKIAYLSGLEFDWQSNFYFLPGALKGLVMNINYTFISSSAQYPFTELKENGEYEENPFTGILTPLKEYFVDYYEAPLVDQPEHIVNIGLGYDYKGFSARVSMLYQSRIFKGSNQWRELSSYNKEYLRWDFTARQKLGHGFEIFTNVNNITSAKDVTVIRATGYDKAISNYGMTVDLGLRWRL